MDEDEPDLIECLVLVSCVQDGPVLRPVISYQYPDRDPVPSNLSQFCFPDSRTLQRDFYGVTFYTFMLTSSDGRKQFGFCVRSFGSDTLPFVICLLTF